MFRKSALARLSSPEQLDQLMQVTDTRAWWMLAALGAMLFAALVWSIFGRLPTTVQGSGILLREGGVFDVQAAAGGQVVQLRTAEQQSVVAGDVVAKVAQQELLRQIVEARQVLDGLRRRRELMSAYSAEELKGRLAVLEQQGRALRTDTATMRGQIQYLTSRLSAQQEAQRLGLVTGDQVEAVRQQLDATRSRLANSIATLQQLGVQTLTARQETETTLHAVDGQIADSRRQLLMLEGRIEQAEGVVTPYTGVVLEVKVDEGSIIAPGSSVLSVELADYPLRAMIVVPVTGRKAQKGMDARVVPATVNWQEAGYLVGTVESVSEQPVTIQRLQRLLHNDVLAQGLMSAGAPYLIEISLQPDTGTFSGYRWTTRAGPRQKVSSGMLASGRIVVDEQRPISLVIPTLRKTFGF